MLGGILLIIGTSIGGGMLALPVSTSQTGFIDSSLFLVLSWLVMTVGALLLLEVNLYLESGANIISMAYKTLGTPGKVAAWCCYLMLLYTLLCAYISGGSDVLHELLKHVHIDISNVATTLLFTSCLGSFIYLGIRSVDYLNRGLMFAKLSVYFILVFLIAPHISFEHLKSGEMKYITHSILILITSFGFASIVPSLRAYFDSDVKTLRKIIIIGSFIPLLCYLTWNAVIMGVIPLKGFTHILHSDHTNSELTHTLSLATKNIWITDFFRMFSSICMLTAFLGVSLGLFDFLADGLKLRKKGSEGMIVLGATFLPPVFIVLFHPNAYLSALSIAGILCVILLLFLPALMAYRGRYQLHLKCPYQVKGGKFTVFFAIFAAMILLAIAIYRGPLQLLLH